MLVQGWIVEPAQQGQQPKKARSGYNAKAMAEIRNSLRPFEETQAASLHPTGVSLPTTNQVVIMTITWPPPALHVSVSVLLAGPP